MSQVKLEMIWQHDTVLPYILNDLKQQIETITTVHKIVLYGSRAKTSIENWNMLKGKDWDIIVVADSPLINTEIWTRDKNYHIDLKVISKEEANTILKYLRETKILYPENQLQDLLD
ncbi:nucleotidyltransferase domain-containing protein [Pontimicrobium sp. MEBiC01747]